MKECGKQDCVSFNYAVSARCMECYNAAKYEPKPEEAQADEQISSVRCSSFSYLRGHKIEFINNEWVYSDNGQPTEMTHKDRPCGKCGKYETNAGHDECLQTLPGVLNACCGHGMDDTAYIQFLDNVVINGQDAIKLQEIMKKYCI